MGVANPDIVEAVLPPGLHIMPGTEGTSETKGQKMDLVLKGPDNQPRSFELYWKEESGPVSVMLKPETVELSNDNGLLWEGTIPDMIRADHLRVIVSDAQGMGKVNVDALSRETWQIVATNAATTIRANRSWLTSISNRKITGDSNSVFSDMTNAGGRHLCPLKKLWFPEQNWAVDMRMTILSLNLNVLTAIA